ncbi:Nucleolar protein 58 [Dimargaris cristalligena]|nr:Nucleolar protein 58 [Dimargaris cristalligena]
MLVLYETPAGFALFKADGKNLLSNPEDLWQSFATPELASATVQLHGFQKFESTVDALSAYTAVLDAKVPTSLQTFLTNALTPSEWKKQELAVADPKLGSALASALNLKVVSDSSVMELFRGIRSQLDTVLTGLSQQDLGAMSLGLSHSLSRYRLKFSPDKVDTMIIQAIGLLDDLDKELNIYAMRAKEWYGWHFPEMTRIVGDNLMYAKTVRTMGVRTNAATTDLSGVLPDELEQEVKHAAEVSMGTEISDEDITNIHHLCDQVIGITEYRTQLYEYLRHRMLAIAPNLTTLVGELVGARLIAHAGSAMNLAKMPASTIQIMGAEKALFRALKTKSNTPKFGLIYHASLMGQVGATMKGKIARSLGAKAALSIRVDALSEDTTAEMGLAARSKIEGRIRQLESRHAVSASRKGRSKVQAKPSKYEPKAQATYDTRLDSTITKSTTAPVEAITPPAAKESVSPSEPKSEKKEKKDKKDKKRKADDAGEDAVESGETPAKKKKEKKEKKDKKSKD